ncbi:MAG TPA: D-glycero-beta-D-manno-heptose 1-phosphate adenylyltransferase [bacterium]|nr:D-glycero-beta-D-manno-heptose 1-phosphate adenylyltransferase [bacterium]
MKSKIISLKRLIRIARELKRQKKVIVFTNGTFDLLHAGHVMYLEKARKLGDVLIIGVNTDRSVKKYKSPHRPVVGQKDRIRVLTALSCVDFALFFDAPTPARLIASLKPDILVKGADWKKSQIAGAKQVESWGGKLVRMRLLPGRSTTSLIKKIKKLKT